MWRERDNKIEVSEEEPIKLWWVGGNKVVVPLKDLPAAVFETDEQRNIVRKVVIGVLEIMSATDYRWPIKGTRSRYRAEV